MIRSFLVAVSFLTRVPAKLSGEVSDYEVKQSSAYFGIVGLLIGAVQGLTFWALFPITSLVAAVGSTTVAVLITGAFHHDGLADSADAFVGGWTPQQRREILKGSTLGTYGVMALILVVLFEVALLASLEPVAAFTGLVAAHTISRTAAVALAALSRNTGTGLARLGSGETSPRLVVMLLASGVILAICGFGSNLASPVRPVEVLPAVLVGFGGLGLLVFLVVLGGRYAKQKVGVVTGDTLGAVERISFGFFLLCWVVWHTV